MLVQWFLCQLYVMSDTSQYYMQGPVQLLWLSRPDSRSVIKMGIANQPLALVSSQLLYQSEFGKTVKVLPVCFNLKPALLPC